MVGKLVRNIIYFEHLAISLEPGSPYIIFLTHACSIDKWCKGLYMPPDVSKLDFRKCPRDLDVIEVFKSLVKIASFVEGSIQVNYMLNFKCPFLSR